MGVGKFVGTMDLNTNKMLRKHQALVKKMLNSFKNIYFDSASLLLQSDEHI